jgi:hypothetical protein
LSTLSSRASGISQPQQTGGNQPEAEGTFSQRISSEDSAVTDFARDFTGVQLSFAGLRPAAPIQRQAVVTSPDEPCEREAENVADQVTRRGSPVTISSPTPLIQRLSSESNREQPMRAVSPAPARAAELAIRTTEDGGVPLPHDVNSYFGRALGYDFSRVRLHADDEGAAAANRIDARAYTVGDHIAFASGEYAPGNTSGNRLLAHELVHVIQQTGVAGGIQRPAFFSHTNFARYPIIQRQPKGQEKDTKTEKQEPPKGPHQRVYVVRDKKLSLGGELVQDMEALKSSLISTKTEGEWTLVLSIHGSEDRLGAQSGPDWQKNAKFYDSAKVETLFGQDKNFVKWRNKYGPTSLSLVSCQVSQSFEGTIIKNLTRVGKSGGQSAKGLGQGCKPIASTATLKDAPASKAAFEKLPASKRDLLFEELKKLNNEWGYYGAPPVPENQILDYYYNEEPKAAWVKVEVKIGRSHNVEDLKSTDIPFWNRTTGEKSAQFRKLCDQGVGQLKRKHEATVPPDPD